MLLGDVAAEWAALEHEMEWLFGHLLPTYDPSPKTAGGLPRSVFHIHALIIFQSLDSLAQRRKLLERIGKRVILDQGLFKELKDELIPAIRKAGELRNDLIHAKWCISEEYPDDLIQFRIIEGNLVYTELDFNKAIDRIVSTKDTIAKFTIKVRNSLRGK